MIPRHLTSSLAAAADAAIAPILTYGATHAGQRSVSVQVTSVVRASDRSFQVKWIEQTFERGSLARAERWTAMLTVMIRPPRTADALRKNPLGLFVEAIDWSRELDASAPAVPQPPARRVPPAEPIPDPEGDNP